MTDAVLLLAQEERSSGGPANFILPVLILGAFYLLLIRPQRTRLRAAQRTQAALAPGREVMTTAGLYATVVDVDDAAGTVSLEIAPGVTARFARAAIATVVEPPAAETGDPEE